MKKPSIFVLVDSPRLTAKIPKKSINFDFIPTLASCEAGLNHEVKRIKRIVKDRVGEKGIVAVNDRTSEIASLITNDLGLIGPSPKSVAKAQHKEYATSVFEKIGASTVNSVIINPGEGGEVDSDLFPIFYRPVKGSLSRNAGLATSPKEFQKKILEFRADNKSFVKWYEDFFKIADRDFKSISRVVVQPKVNGKQYTADGWVHDGKTYILVISQSVFHQNFHSFDRFELPVDLDSNLYKKLEQLAHDFVSSIGFNYSGFNLEFFITEDEEIHFIEFNTRSSLQFFPMFDNFLQTKYFESLAWVSLGINPAVANTSLKNFFTCQVLRKENNYFVSRVPSKEEVLEIKNKFPNLLHVSVFCKQGLKLSDFPQDSYSYRYADFTIFGKNKKELQMLIPKISNELDKYFIFESIQPGEKPHD